MDTLFHINKHKLQQQLVHRICSLMEVACCHYQRAFPKPRISFDLKGLVAGMALLEKNVLRFNNELLIMYGDTFINETAAHELAHLLAYQLHGKGIKPHGREWRTIMVNVFASEPQVTHSFATNMQRKEVYIYRCDCRTRVEFSKIRHSRVKKGVRYMCRLCKTNLVYSGKQ